MQEVTIGIDLGGTRIKAVAIDIYGNVLHQFYTSTQDGDDKIWKQKVADTLREIKMLVPQSSYSLGISAPGLPNESYSAIAFMPGRMQGLENFIWKEYLNHPAYVVNDGVAAMMAEAKFGEAKDYKHAVMITLGTGVGGAILIDGKPYMGAFNKAGHIGHMVINDELDPDVTGMPGSLEDCIGNCTIQKRSNGQFSSTHDLIAAYHQGDTFAKAVWLKSIRQLAIGIASISNILSPQVIILGGGITEAGDDLFIPLNEYISQYEWRPGGGHVQVIKAVFGDLAGAIGAACFAIQMQNQ
ncbi:MAG: ROK family protein [Saprospiraceae bacterium]